MFLFYECPRCKSRGLFFIDVQGVGLVDTHEELYAQSAGYDDDSLMECCICHYTGKRPEFSVEE